MDIDEIRRRNLWSLVHPYGYSDKGVKLFAEKTGKTEQRIRHLVAKKPETKTFKNIGKKAAREFEDLLGKPSGWLDQRHFTLEIDDIKIEAKMNKKTKGMVFASSDPDVFHVNKGTEIREIPMISSKQAVTWREDFEQFSRKDHDDWRPLAVSVPPKCYALEMDGDTMTSSSVDSIPHGMNVVIDPDFEPAGGDIIAVHHKPSGSVLIKELVTEGANQYLKSLNTQYAPIRIDNEYEILGTAIAKMLYSPIPFGKNR